jgi:DNA repair exonuclease SbcCD ATPase subunit
MPPVELAKDNDVVLPEGATGEVLEATDEVRGALTTITEKHGIVTALVAKAAALHEKYKDVVADISTTAGMATYLKIRADFRDEVRLPLQEAQEEGSKILGTMQRQYNTWTRGAIDKVKALEKPWDDAIKAEEARKAEIKAKAAAKETARRRGHAERIATIAGLPAAAQGLGSVELRARMADAQSLEATITMDAYEEFTGMAQQALHEAVRQLNGMLMAALTEEAEAAELAAERERQAVVRANQAAKEAELAERERKFAEDQAAAAEKARADQEALERQQRELAEQQATQARAVQERKDAVQRRIAAIETIGEPLAGRASDDLEGIGNHLLTLTINEDLYGDRVQEAIAAADRRVEAVAAEHAVAVAREKKAAADQLAARIEELLNNIKAIGESALLAAQDGSADVEKMRAVLAQLEGDLLPRELAEHRFEEANRLRDEASTSVREAIAATIERDRLRAEKEERERVQRAEHEAARELANLKRAHGEELYEMVRKVIIEDSGLAIAPAARALLLRINPAEDFEE